MDPRKCKTTTEKLDTLQSKVDLIIKDIDMTPKNKTLDRSSWKKKLVIIFSSKSQLSLTTLRQKIANNAKKIYEDILGGDTLILNKTRGKYKEEFLNSILLKTWSLIPSTNSTLSPPPTSFSSTTSL